MIQTTIIPDDATIKINIPLNYIGKKVHAIFFMDEEISKNVELPINKIATDFLEMSNQENKEAILANNSKISNRNEVVVSPLIESLTGVIPAFLPENDDYYDYLSKKYL